MGPEWTQILIGGGGGKQDLDTVCCRWLQYVVKCIRIETFVMTIFAILSFRVN
jgi:hypothetical protein